MDVLNTLTLHSFFNILYLILFQLWPFSANYIKTATAICVAKPDVADSCDASDGKMPLLSYAGNIFVESDLVLLLQKKIGVGRRSLVSDEGQYEFEFYESIGFKITESLSTLSDNFKRSLIVSDETDFDWISQEEHLWREEETILINISPEKGCSLEVYDIVGKCSFIDVRPASYVRVDICSGFSNETVVDVLESISD